MPSKTHINLSDKISDEIKTTTCYMCACRCGIQVHMRNGKIRYIDGNRNHPINKGVICGKGAAGIMHHYSPARLTAPLKRIGPRGSGKFKEISWDEALELATDWLADVRHKDPSKLAFFTGRDQSQSLTGWWAMQYGTPNYAAHGGFCSVNMAAAGLYTIGGAFWEFGEPDWQHTKYFMLFGVAEEHGSNPMKMNLGKLKERGAKFVSINPVQTGYSAIADEWLGICPGTDGLFVGALIHELFRTQQIDFDYLLRYTNAPWLVIQDAGHEQDGLFVRNQDGCPLVYDEKTSSFVSTNLPENSPALAGDYTLPNGQTAIPVFQLLATRFLTQDYCPENVAEKIGIAAKTIKRIAQELAHTAFQEEITLDIPWTDWTGRKHDKMIGRPVSMHAMRGISAHSNGFHTCRMIHILQILLGSIDCPGGFRYKPPYPRQTPPWLKPFGKKQHVNPDEPLGGPHLGFPTSPEDLLVDKDGTPCRIDKAFSWDAPLSAHGLMHMVITNAGQEDPYPVDVLFMYMANMGWNSSMNIPDTLKYLTEKDETTDDYKIPKIIYSDAFYSETIPYADLILPDTTYLERWDCISLLDRPISEPDGPADSIRQPVVQPDRNVRPFQDVLIDLGSRLKLPGFIHEDNSPKYPGGYADYIVNHERKPGIGPLSGWRGQAGDKYGSGEPNPDQLQKYIENGCFHFHELKPSQKYFKHANLDYINFSVEQGYRAHITPVIFQIYSEELQKFRLAAQGHGTICPPDHHKERIKTYFDPLPFWYAPFEQAAIDEAAYPMHAITQRPMHMYHSWGSQNAWLRQITNENRLYIHRRKAKSLDLNDDDWVWLSSHIGRVKCQVKLMTGVNPDTVWTWNAIGKRSGTWGLDEQAPEAKNGFLLNHLISELLPNKGGYRYSNSDPVTGQAAWYDLRVHIEKASPEHKETLPRFETIPTHNTLAPSPEILDFGREFKEVSQ